MSWFIGYLVSVALAWVIYCRFLSDLNEREGDEMLGAVVFSIFWPIVLVGIGVVVGYRKLFRFLRTSRIQRRREEDRVEDMLKKGPKL